MHYQYKSVSTKASLLGANALPVDGYLDTLQLNGPSMKLPSGDIRLCSNGYVDSAPFLFPAGHYRVRIQTRGNRVKGETAHFRLSIGKKAVITGFTKEKPHWHEGELKVENADVFPITVTFENDYFQKIGPTTPLVPGSVIKLSEGDWDGTLTRIHETGRYAAHWVNKTTGERISDIVTVRTFTPASIVLYRKSLKGCYRGKLFPDGKSATGTADWYKGNGKWKARFPDMKFPGNLDRNLDILQIKIEKMPYISIQTYLKFE